MKNKKKIMVLVSILALLLVVGIGVTYSLWSKTYTQSGENKLISDCFHLQFIEEENSNISLENSFPILDSEGKKLKPYRFSIQNLCHVAVEYQINFETLQQTTMKDEYVKVMFQEDEPILLNQLQSVQSTITNGKNAYELETGYLLAEETKEYHLRIWMDENVTQNDEGAMNSNHTSKITVIASYLTKYVEPILNGTDPVLKEGLIPVTIDNDGVVKKADESKEWYSYEKKTWANAVILNDESLDYQDGEVIPEDNIESYFVWIPRYRYQIFNEGNYEGLTTIENRAQEIKIVFEQNTVAKSNGTTVGQWLTHPAFTSFDVNGMWVGKFETGYKGSTDITSAQKNVNEPNSVQIKPNVNSWRSIQVVNAYLTSYDYKRNYNSHMMKNTEWGAVAYLQHSKYGSMASVRINNNSNYVTGYSAVNEPTCGYTGDNRDCNKHGTSEDVTKPWNTSTGYLASTTGNIYGVYDMSGGTWEYVMGVMMNQNGKPMSGKNHSSNSGFNGSYSCPTCNGETSGLTSLVSGINFPNDSRYYDLYTYAENDETYQRRILGDATGEMGPFSIATYGTKQRQVGSWYEDEAVFINTTNSWFARGVMWNHGIDAGIFTFGGADGSSVNYCGFRIVLSV